MRSVLAVVFGVVWLLLVPSAHAQYPYTGSGLPYQGTAYGSYVRTTVALPLTPIGRSGSAIGVNTSVSVPDGGEAYLGGYTAYSSGRNQFGTPGLSNLPYLGRLGTNTGYGYSIRTVRATVRVRVFSMEEEELRQTGVGR